MVWLFSDGHCSPPISTQLSGLSRTIPVDLRHHMVVFQRVGFRC